MRGHLGTAKVLGQIAFRNLFASRLKTAIVGGIVFFGALLVVVGSSVVDSVDRAMSGSIIGSVAGDIQVYSAESKDDLLVMGSMDVEGADIVPLGDFAAVNRTLRSIPNVKAVVPMGINGAFVASGNTVDLALEKLREAARRKGAGDRSPEVQETYEGEKAHVQQIVEVLRDEFDNRRKMQNDAAMAAEDLEAITRAAAPTFWAGFDRDPFGALEFLENRLAPLASDADTVFLQYVGTDLEVFGRSFDRLKIVDGKPIPRGQRGFLFSKLVYEDQLKLKTARRLDKIKDAREQRGRTIAGDPGLQRFVRENSNQVSEILLQLDGRETAFFRKELQRELGSAESDVARLLSEFFRTDDANFDRRYRLFYDRLAPALELYRVRIGDTLVIKAFARSGYVRSVKVRVYGSFAFEGLEKSQLGGSLNLMDLVSFRELYNFTSAASEQEIQALKASVQAQPLERDQAEQVLFGKRASTRVEEESTPPPHPESAALRPVRFEDLVDRPYDQRELERGVVLNAAVILRDPSRTEETRAAIEAAGKRAGLPLRAISWRKASGMLGQMVTTMQVVLYSAVLIIFVVALVIINNALVMATLERVQEIGTLRAVGARRRFVLVLVILEAVLVGAVFGALGAGVGALLVWLMGRVGIPAPNDIFLFFFSGPRLYPALGTANLAAALAIVFLVSAASSLYPAWLATRFSPRRAMQTEE